MKHIPVITEFLGTFGLMMVIQASIQYASGMEAFTIGAGLAVLVYSGFRFSGAQYNPAVSLMLVISGHMKLPQAIRFILAQFLGAAAALWLTGLLIGDYTVIGPRSTFGLAFLVELAFTFALGWVIFVSVLIQRTQGKYYGLAIGAIVMIGILVGGSASGAAFNPAIGITPSALTSNGMNTLLYLVGPLSGAGLAAITYNKLFTR